MKNKIMGIVMALIVMIGLIASQVKAAEISANNTEVNVGDKIVVTVNLTEETRAIDLVLKYDASKFEYVKGSISSSLGTGLTVNDTVPGEVRLSAANPTATTKSVSYTFNALELTEDAGAEFNASGLVTEGGEGFTVDTVSVKVVEPVKEPEEPTTPEEPEEPATPEEPTIPEENNGNESTQGNKENSNSAKVDDEGNKITKLPQTGVTIYQVVAGVALVVVAGAVVFAVRKIRK